MYIFFFHRVIARGILSNIYVYIFILPTHIYPFILKYRCMNCYMSLARFTQADLMYNCAPTTFDYDIIYTYMYMCMNKYINNTLHCRSQHIILLVIILSFAS